MSIAQLSGIRCTLCECRCVRPLSTLMEVFQNLPASSESFSRINFACPQCHQLVTGEIFTGEHVRVFEGGPEQPSIQNGKTEFAVEVRCEKADCLTPAIVFIPSPEPQVDPDGVPFLLNRYGNAGIRCQQGHHVLFPYNTGKVRTISG